MSRTVAAGVADAADKDTEEFIDFEEEAPASSPAKGVWATHKNKIMVGGAALMMSAAWAWTQVTREVTREVTGLDAAREAQKQTLNAEIQEQVNEMVQKVQAEAEPLRFARYKAWMKLPWMSEGGPQKYEVAIKRIVALKHSKYNTPDGEKQRTAVETERKDLAKLKMEWERVQDQLRRDFIIDDTGNYLKMDQVVGAVKARNARLAP